MIASTPVLHARTAAGREVEQGGALDFVAARLEKGGQDPRSPRHWPCSRRAPTRTRTPRLGQAAKGRDRNRLSVGARLGDGRARPRPAEERPSTARARPARHFPRAGSEGGAARAPPPAAGGGNRAQAADLELTPSRTRLSGMPWHDHQSYRPGEAAIVARALVADADPTRESTVGGVPTETIVVARRRPRRRSRRQPAGGRAARAVALAGSGPTSSPGGQRSWRSTACALASAAGQRDGGA